MLKLDFTKMKRFEVIKEFPGLKVGDILIEDEGTDFYINYKEELDVSETSEKLYVNTVALNKDAVLQNVGEYFKEIIDEKEEQESSLITDMTQTASYLEGDLIMAINDYHREKLQQMLDIVYTDINTYKYIESNYKIKEDGE